MLGLSAKLSQFRLSQIPRLGWGFDLNLQVLIAAAANDIICKGVVVLVVVVWVGGGGTPASSSSFHYSKWHLQGPVQWSVTTKSHVWFWICVPPFLTTVCHSGTGGCGDQRSPCRQLLLLAAPALGQLKKKYRVSELTKFLIFFFFMIRNSLDELNQPIWLQKEWVK